MMKIDPNKRYVGVTQAIKMTFNIGLGTPSRPTIATWVQKYNLGIKIGGRWRIDKQRFEEFLRSGE